MPDVGDLFGEPLQLIVTGHKRIATTIDNFADGSVSGNVVQRILPFRPRRPVFLVREVATETIAAVDCAVWADDQQKSAMVFVNQSWHRVGLLLCQRVLAVTGHSQQFLANRQDLSKQGIVWITFFNSTQIGVGYPHLKITVGSQRFPEVGPIQFQKVKKLFGVANTGRQLLLPAGAIQTRRRTGYHSALFFPGSFTEC